MHPKTVLQNKLSDIRHMLYVMESSAFDEKYAKDKTYIDGVIASCDRVAFDIWMESDKTLDDLSIRQLRIKAARAGITRYSRLDKAELVRRLDANSQKHSQHVGGHASNNGAGQDK